MKWPSKNFWCFTTLYLDEVASVLSVPFALKLSGGCENTWEWKEGRDGVGSYWNLSRQWDDDKANIEFPLRIVVDPVPKNPLEFANKLSGFLKVTVSFGTVEYIGGDDFTFREDFRSKTT